MYMYFFSEQNFYFNIVGFHALFKVRNLVHSWKLTAQLILLTNWLNELKILSDLQISCKTFESFQILWSISYNILMMITIDTRV